MVSHKATAITFIERCKRVHGDRYGYELVCYTRAADLVKIICHEHGVFSQRANNHLHGQGCPECRRKQITKTQSNFIEEAIVVHGNKYNYNLSKYINGHSKIIILCPFHGKFKQLPQNHLSGRGCPHCFHENNRLSLQEFIERANIIHHSKYDYSFVKLTLSSDKINIYCPLHDKCFEQVASIHLSGRGCSDCGYETVTKKLMKSCDSFIEEAITIHGNKYDYSKVDYQGMQNKIEIICAKHGSFYQRPTDHIFDGNGCPKCSYRVSYVETEWLDSINIPDDKWHRQVRLSVNGRIIIADGFMPETNTIYEFYGDKWHGNPKVYDHSDIKAILGSKPYSVLYQNTMDRERLIKNAGYNLITIWESDWRKHD
jgi:hypothetical protein